MFRSSHWLLATKMRFLLRTVGFIVDKVTLEHHPSASHIRLLAKATNIVGPFEIVVVSTPLCSICVFFRMLYSDLKLNILFRN